MRERMNHARPNSGVWERLRLPLGWGRQNAMAKPMEVDSFCYWPALSGQLHPSTGKYNFLTVKLFLGKLFWISLFCVITKRIWKKIRIIHKNVHNHNTRMANIYWASSLILFSFYRKEKMSLRETELFAQSCTAQVTEEGFEVRSFDPRVCILLATQGCF